jgi:hypothetical protein
MVNPAKFTKQRKKPRGRAKEEMCVLPKDAQMSIDDFI